MNIPSRFPVKTIDFVFETLPLGQTQVRIMSFGLVGSVDKTEVDKGLKIRPVSATPNHDVTEQSYIIKCRVIGIGIILQEITRYSGIANMRRWTSFSHYDKQSHKHSQDK